MGKKREKNSARRAERAERRLGERTNARLASLAEFFFALFPHRGACSQARWTSDLKVGGLRPVPYHLVSLRPYSIFLSPARCINGYLQTVRKINRQQNKEIIQVA